MVNTGLQLYEPLSENTGTSQDIEEEAGGGQEGGWIPVIRKHKGQSGHRGGSRATFTLFVDNIPESKDLRWLKWAFNRFGVVRDAFIPQKRSKRTGNHFGFVRHDCHAAADMTISKMNGVWVENTRLFAKGLLRAQ